MQPPSGPLASRCALSWEQSESQRLACDGPATRLTRGCRTRSGSSDQSQQTGLDQARGCESDRAPRTRAVSILPPALVRRGIPVGVEFAECRSYFRASGSPFLTSLDVARAAQLNCWLPYEGNCTSEMGAGQFSIFGAVRGRSSLGLRSRVWMHDPGKDRTRIGCTTRCTTRAK
jgi:hypothetical protein